MFKAYWIAGTSKRDRESRLGNAKKTITLVRTIGHHWCENLYLDLTTDASIKEVKREKSRTRRYAKTWLEANFVDI